MIQRSNENYWISSIGEVYFFLFQFPCLEFNKSLVKQSLVWGTNNTVTERFHLKKVFKDMNVVYVSRRNDLCKVYEHYTKIMMMPGACCLLSDNNSHHNDKVHYINNDISITSTHSFFLSCRYELWNRRQLLNMSNY